jgi:transposase
MQPHTTEWRRHAVTHALRHKTRAAYDEDTIPASPFGPRLMGIVALLTGVYRVAAPGAQAAVRPGRVPISLGAISAVEARVSEAVKPAVDERGSASEVPR